MERMKTIIIFILSFLLFSYTINAEEEKGNTETLDKNIGIEVLKEWIDTTKQKTAVLEERVKNYKEMTNFINYNLEVRTMATSGPLSKTSHRPSADISEESLQSFHASLKSGTPILESLYQQLHQKDGGKWAGVAYSLTHDNQLMPNWLAQTPNVWGQSAGDVEKGAGDFIVHDVQELIAGAEKFVDITSLYPYPDGQFKEAIKEGLIDLAHSGRAVKVRILVGWYPGPTQVDQTEYLTDLIEPLKSISKGNLEIYVAAQRTDPLSWNHAKMVAVDGRAAILGGENLWDGDYLESEPVHDLNIKLQGSTVFHMHRFADTIWHSVCGYWEPSWKPVNWNSGSTQITKGCLDTSLSNPDIGAGTLSVLGAGRYAGLVDDENPADYAMLLALQASESVIRIAQQDLEFYSCYWEPGIRAIAKALVKNQDVYIVLSNDYGKSGSGNSYSTGYVADTADKIREYVSEEPDAPKDKELINLLCSKLHISTLRFGASDKWTNPHGYEFANHSKFIMVDDKIFYVGSENLYPSNLIEYGVFVSDSNAVQQMRELYWDPLWKYSSRVAISGSGVSNCHFRE